jgi:hypothetical protein
MSINNAGKKDISWGEDFTKRSAKRSLSPSQSRFVAPASSIENSLQAQAISENKNIQPIALIDKVSTKNIQPAVTTDKVDAPLQSTSVKSKIVEKAKCVGKGLVNTTAWFPAAVLNKILDDIGDHQVGKVKGAFGFTTGAASGTAPEGAKKQESEGQKAESASVAKQEAEAPATSVGSYLHSVAQLLHPYLNNALAPFSQQAFNGIVFALVLALENALKSIEGREHYDTAREAIGILIEKLKVIQKSGSAQDLYNTVTESLKVLETFKIYINGVKLPHFGRNEESALGSENTFLENITALQKVEYKKPPATQSQPINWKVKASEEMDEFVDNTVSYLAMKLIYEHVCKLSPVSDQLYFDMISSSRKKGSPKGLRNEQSRIAFSLSLKEAFFDRLKKDETSTLKHVLAYLLFPLFAFLLKGFIQNFSQTYLQEAFKFIEKNKENNFRQMKNIFVKNFTRYLQILGGVYKEIGNAKPTGLISEMVQERLSTPESNLGYEPSTLYANFARDIIDKSTRSPVISWLFKKLIGNEELIVRSILDESLGSIMDAHGYTHALNCVLVEQLKDILRELQEKKTNKEKPANEETAFSKQKIKELETLVKNLFEVLKMVQQQTHSELEKHVNQERTYSQNIRDFVDDLFMPDVIESITVNISEVIGSLINEQQLHQLTYKFTHLVNTVYEEGQSFTLEEVHAKEKELLELSDCLLNLSIQTAVEEITGNNENQQTEAQITAFKQKTEDFIQSTSDELSIIEKSESLISKEARVQMRNIVEKTLAFQRESLTTSSQIKGSRLSNDNKNELLRRYDKISSVSTAYIKNLAKARAAQKELKEYQKYDEMKLITETIVNLLENPDTAYLTQVMNSEIIVQIMFKLEENRQKAPSLMNHPGLSEDLKQQVNQLGTRINSLQHSLLMISFAQSQLKNDSTLALIKEELEASINSRSRPSQVVKSQVQALRAELQTLRNPIFAQSFEKQLEKMIRSTSLAELELAYKDCQTLCVQTSKDSSTKVESGRKDTEKDCLAIQETIKNALPYTHIEEKKKTIRQLINTAQKSLDAIRFSYQNIGQQPQFVAISEKMRSFKDALQTEGKASELRRLAERFKQAILNGELLYESYRGKLDVKKVTKAMIETLEHYIRSEEHSIRKEDTFQCIDNMAELLKELRAGHERNNPFRSIAHINANAIDVKGVMNMATGLVFGRVKERVDGLLDFIRREETYRYGIIHHLFLIPYVNHLKVST